MGKGLLPSLHQGCAHERAPAPHAQLWPGPLQAPGWAPTLPFEQRGPRPTQRRLSFSEDVDAGSPMGHEGQGHGCGRLVAVTPPQRGPARKRGWHTGLWPVGP